MEYVVTAWGENDKLIRKTFKYRKSAEKFGVKMVEKIQPHTIPDRVNKIIEFIQKVFCCLTSFSVLMRNRNKMFHVEHFERGDNIDCS